MRNHIGRRGAALLAFAFVDFVIGWSLIDPEQRHLANQIPTYFATKDVAPLWVWGWLWIVVGAICFAFAFRRQDRIGFGCAIGIKVVWSLAILASGPLYGVPRAWLGASVWGVVAALVLVIAGWPENSRYPSPSGDAPGGDE